VPGFAATLAALDDAELTGLLERRPDLLAEPAPASFAELANRAGRPASLAAALRLLDRGTLQLAELLAVVGLPTTVADVAEAAGDGLHRARLDEGLAALAALGLAVPGPDDEVSGPRGLAAAFGDPGHLGPSIAELAKIAVTMEHLLRAARSLGLEVGAGAAKAELVASVGAALSDPAVVAGVQARAGEPERRLLDHALTADSSITVMGVGDGRFARHPDAEPASWLLDHGLLLPITYSQFVVPREARLGLRGGLVFPAWPSAPRLDPLDGVPDARDRAGHAAMRIVLAAEGLLGRLDRDPRPLTRSGTVAVRDLKRLARELELADDELSLLVDLLIEAGLLVVGGSWDHRTLGLRPEADAWLDGERATRWADLALAWRTCDLAFEDHLADRRGLAADGAERPRVLAGNRRSAVAARRRGLVAGLADLPDGSAAAAGDLADQLAWRQPMIWPEPPDHRGTATLVVDVAKLLGLVVEVPGGIAAGPAAAEWAGGADAAALAERMRPALPDGTDRLLVAGDLTVVAPDGLAPRVAARLGQLADREGGTWRLHEPSLRRAFDEGASADQVLDFLRGHASAPLPQALEYMVNDAARRHGKLRVGAASTYLRGDAALVAVAVRSKAGRRLGLRELAPGVAVSSKPESDVLAALRGAGEAPLAEEPDGTPRPGSRKAVRHSPRAHPSEVAARAYPVDPGAGEAGARAPAAEGSLCPSELVARLRGGGARGGTGGGAEGWTDDGSPGHGGRGTAAKGAVTANGNGEPGRLEGARRG
jgi:Helicase conserved C-terminal domain